MSNHCNLNFAEVSLANDFSILRHPSRFIHRTWKVGSAWIWWDRTVNAKKMYGNWGMNNFLMKEGMFFKEQLRVSVILYSTYRTPFNVTPLWLWMSLQLSPPHPDGNVFNPLKAPKKAHLPDASPLFRKNGFSLKYGYGVQPCTH